MLEFISSQLICKVIESCKETIYPSFPLEVTSSGSWRSMSFKVLALEPLSARKGLTGGPLLEGDLIEMISWLTCRNRCDQSRKVFAAVGFTKSLNIRAREKKGPWVSSEAFVFSGVFRSWFFWFLLLSIAAFERFEQAAILNTEYFEVVIDLDFEILQRSWDIENLNEKPDGVIFLWV